MLLIPEQIKFLRNSIHRLEEELKECTDYFEGRDSVRIEDSERLQPADHIIEDKYQSIMQQLKKFQELLIHGEYVRKIPTDEIGIGTRFKIHFDDLGTLEYVLVDSVLGNNMSTESISQHSILGQNVIGKKAGDTFSYMASSNPEPITGSIEEICKIEDGKLDFIRSRKADHRKGSITTEEIRQLTSQCGNRVAAGMEYAKQIPITESQIELLEIEIERLNYLLNNDFLDWNRKRVICKRISTIKRILKEQERASSLEDDTIGIGSTFSLMLFEKDRTVIKRVEMIGKAFGDELTDEYVEKISTLGSTIYGLHNNDEFIYHTPHRYIAGKVYDIDNRQENRITDALEYQKRMNKRIG